MNWLDFALNVALLALVPFALAAYGGHLAAETIADVKARRRAKGWFWFLCMVGIVIAAVSQYRVTRAEEMRNRVAQERDLRASEAVKTGKQAQAELAASEKANTRKLLELQGQVNKLLMRPAPAEQKLDELKLKNDIAAAVAERVIPPQQQSITTAPVVPVPAVERVCRGDALKDCTDDQLLKWGAPLVANLEQIEDGYMADLKKLDDIKGGSWIGLLVGVDDKESKWLKAYSQAQEKATERARNCCAENALAYHKELAQRVGGGKENAALYEWLEDILKPLQSKEYKKARENPKVLDVVSDLHQMQIELRFRRR